MENNELKELLVKIEKTLENIEYIQSLSLMRLDAVTPWRRTEPLPNSLIEALSHLKYCFPKNDADLDNGQ
jgi:hypothetical protein